MTKVSWKDLVEQADPDLEADVVVYDFDGPNGEGKFKIPANETGRGVYVPVDEEQGVA